MTYLWLAVTPDEYELPLAIGRTAAELGGIMGVSTTTINVDALKNHSGKRRGWKVIKVSLPPESEDDDAQSHSIF